MTIVKSIAVTGDTPTATDNDYTRIKDAIEAAAAGDEIRLEGLFDWTEANAFASWELGNDGLSGTDDDFSIAVPANLNNVTLTAVSLGDAEILGPGDITTFDLEAFLIFLGGDNQNWTISNLRIVNFDLAIGMFSGAGGDDAFEGTTITNNYILVATDSPDDVSQNIAIHLSFGHNQTITNNVIEFGGDGVSDSGSGLFAASVGLQSNTSAGTAYDGLLIDGNQLRVLNAQSADPEIILGIWENAHGHLSNITVSNNSFVNLAAGNDPALNLQRAFRITSHSGAATTVSYVGNTVEGANIGMQWLAAADFSAHQAVRVWQNVLVDCEIGILIQSQGAANLYQNDIDGSGVAGVQVVTGRLTGSGPVANAVEENFIRNGTGDGLVIGATVTVTGAIFNNHLGGNGGQGINNASATVLDASGNYWGAVDPADVAAAAGGNVDYTPWLDSGTDASAGTPGFQGDFSTLHVDDDSPQVGGTGRIQEGVNLLTTGGTLFIHAGNYPETVAVNKTATLEGASGVAADVVIDPPAGNGINVTANNVVLRALRVTDAAAGIHLNSAANFTLDNVQVDNCTNAGLDVDSLTGTLTIANSTFFLNDNGIDVLGGAVGSTLVISNTDSFQNNANGLIGSGWQAGVSISSSSFNDNGGHGVELNSSFTSNGDIVFNKVFATGNDPGIFINGAASFSDTDGNYSNNDDHGIQLIDIAGDVTLVRTVADDNDADDDNIGDGLNATASANPFAIGGNLIVQGAAFRQTAGNHQFNGVFVESVGGNVFFEDSAGPAQSVVVTGNENIGVYVGEMDNATFTNGTYSANGNSGVQLGLVSGDASFDNVVADDNGGVGVYIVSGGVNASFVGGSFSGNGLDGILLASFTGTVTLDGIAAENNGGDGFDVFDVATLNLVDLVLSGNAFGGRIDTVVTVNYTASTGNVADTVVVENDRFQRTSPPQQEILYTQVDTLNVYTEGGNDVIHVRSTHQNTDYFIYAGAGDDVINVGNAANSLDDIAGDLTIDGGGNSADLGPAYVVTACDGEPGEVSVTLQPVVGDIVNFNDAGSAADNNYQLTATTFRRLAVSPTALMTYNAVETINVDTGSGDDLVNVTSTAAGSTTTINTHDGADTVNVLDTGAASVTLVNAGNENDVAVAFGTGAGSITILNGDAGNDTLVLIDNGAASGVQLNGGSGADLLLLVFSGAGSAVEANGGSGADQIYLVQSAAGSATDLNGGKNNDEIFLGRNPFGPVETLNLLQGTICVDGGGHKSAPENSADAFDCDGDPYTKTLVAGDRLEIADGLTVAPHTYLLEPDYFTRIGVNVFDVMYHNIETVVLTAGQATDLIVAETAPSVTTILNTNTGNDEVRLLTGDDAIVLVSGGPGNNTIFLLGAGQESVTRIETQGGADVVNVGSNSNSVFSQLDTIVGDVVLDGGAAGGDVLSFNDFASTTGHHYQLRDGLFSRTGTGAIAFAAFETLNLDAGSGNDKIQVLATTPGAENFLFGNDGNDRLLICSTAGPTYLFGGNGDDEFAFADQATLSGGFIQGSAGIDTLNYAAYTTDVRINLGGAFYGFFPAIDPITGAPMPIFGGLPGNSATGTAGVFDVENAVGGSGNDMIVGSDAGNQLEGGPGNDLIDGLGGDDFLFGGDSTYADFLFGGDGNDWIDGQGGPDVMIGGSGDDILISGNGPPPPFFAFRMMGGPGFDLFVINDCCDALNRTNTIDAGGVGGDGGQIVLRFGPGGENLYFHPTLQVTSAEEICDPTCPNDAQAVAAVSSQHRYVEGLYQRLLGRSASAAEVELWVGALNRGLGRDKVVQTFLNTDEARAYYVHQVYQRHLGRAADAPGLAYWVGRMRSGMAWELVDVAVLASDEYLLLRGGFAGMIDGVFQALLGRGVDAPSLAFWTTTLAGGYSKQQFVQMVLGVTEAKSYFVSRLYLDLLGRSPDLDGLSAWINGLNKGMSRLTVLTAFLASDEYYARS